MRSFLLASGARALNSVVPPQRLLVQGFQVGRRAPTAAELDVWDRQEIALADMQGPIEHRAGFQQISWGQTGANEIRLTCTITDLVQEIQIGNIVILVGINPASAVPFSYSGSPRAAVKLATTLNSAGTYYPFHFTLSLPSLFSRFDFSNLERRVPEWPPVADEFGLPDPTLDGHDQFVVQRHSEFGGPHPVFNVNNRYYGLPDCVRLDQNQARSWLLSGGVSGDGYRKD